MLGVRPAFGSALRTETVASIRIYHKLYDPASLTTPPIKRGPQKHQATLSHLNLHAVLQILLPYLDVFLWDCREV